MDCGICLEAFDAARRRPKVLPCGHSACTPCLEGLREKRCAVCRREFTSAVENLPDNFAIISSLASSSRRPKMWCINCQAVAKPDCFDDHTLKSAKNALRDELVTLQVQTVLVAEDLPEALSVDDDGAREQALRALQLARQPGTTMEVSVRGLRGESLTATWMKPPAAPAGQQGSVDAVEAVATNVLVLALAKKGLWQQRGVKREREGEEHQEDRNEAEATPDLPVMEELRVLPTRRIEVLQSVRQHRVRRLTRVNCSADAAWSLQLLQLATPHLEELQLSFARREHLLAVLAMPRLNRLKLMSHSADQSDFPAELPPLPAHAVGLRWLYVNDLPRETTASLLRAHNGTLEVLMLCVGVSTPAAEEWPEGCSDLHAALGRCGLARLQRLVLWRGGRRHNKYYCRAQLRAVRGALPVVEVQCNVCDDVELRF